LNWKVEDGIFICTIKTKVLSDGDLRTVSDQKDLIREKFHVVEATRAIVGRVAVAHEAIRPNPINVLDRGRRLLEHYLS
jgi:hypothetical protein